MRAMTQSFARQPLSSVFSNAANVRVLRELSRTGGESSARMLSERSKLTKPSVLASLAHLEALGFVLSLGSSRSRLYRIDDKHPLAPKLTALFVEEDHRFGRIMSGIHKAAHDAGVAAAWLYGSVARGEDGWDSDIDLAIVTDEDAVAVKTKVREALRDREDLERFSASVLGFHTDDIVRLAAEQDPWWMAMCQDAVPLIGPPPDVFVARSRSKSGVA